jgi:rare lipoprotein A
MLEIALIGACLLAAGCGTTPIAPNERGSVTVPPTTMPPPPAVAAPAARGGYYLDDGPGENPPDLTALADAKPKLEPLHRAALRPYVALGKSYTPMTQVAPYKARGTATWYGKRYHGKPTSTGDRYDMYAMTAAHTTLPLPSYVRVTSVANGRSVVVRVNDRGPFHSDRLIDLSYAAAWKLGLVAGGSGLVDVEAIVPDALGRDDCSGRRTGARRAARRRRSRHGAGRRDDGHVPPARCVLGARLRGRLHPQDARRAA